LKNYQQTILSQYYTSPTLRTLLDAINQWISPDADFEAFYDDIWNIDTAVGYGLDVWGRIVGVQRVLTITEVDYFGFSGPRGPSGQPFNQAPFYEGEAEITQNYRLTDQAFRQLIFAKAAQNITDCGIPSLNSILVNILFPGRGNAFVRDNLNMTMTYVFNFTLQPFEVAIVTQSGVLPRPTGVAVNYTYLM
jgi:hypothetical protein